MISFEDLRNKKNNGSLNSVSISMMSNLLKRASEGLSANGDDPLAKQLAEFEESFGSLLKNESEEEARRHYEKICEFKAFIEGGRDNERTNYQKISRELLPHQQQSFDIVLDLLNRELDLGIKEDVKTYEGIGSRLKNTMSVQDDVADTHMNTTAAAYIERIKLNGFPQKDPARLSPGEKDLYISRIAKIMAARQLADSDRGYAAKLEACILNSDVVDERAKELMKDKSFKGFLQSLQDDPVRLKKAISAGRSGHGGGLDDMFKAYLLKKDPATLDNSDILKRWMPTAIARIDALKDMLPGSDPEKKARIAAEIIQIRNMIKADKGKKSSLKFQIPLKSQAGDLAETAMEASKSDVLRDPSLNDLLTQGHGGNMMERARFLSNTTLYPEPDAKTKQFYEANSIKTRMEQIKKEAGKLCLDMRKAIANQNEEESAERMAEAKDLLAEYILLDGKTRNPNTNEIDERRRLKDVPWGEIRQMKQTGVENNPAFRQLVSGLDPKSMAGRLAELAGKEQKDFIMGLAEVHNDQQKEDVQEEYQEPEPNLNTSVFDEGIEEDGEVTEQNGVIRGFSS